MSESPTPIVVFGTGSIGTRHIDVLRTVPGVHVIAVPVRSERVAELRANGLDARTLSDALATEPRGAVIATNTGRHVADAAALLEQCHLLIEKPLAADAAGARRIVDVARGRARRVHVACCLRFDPGLVWVHGRIADLGSLRLADAECLSWLPAWRPNRDYAGSYSAQPGEGGVLLDLVHEIDFCSWLLGPVRRVAARLENRGALGLPAGVEETASLLLAHTSGLTTSLRLSYAVRPSSRRFRIWGDAGQLEWDGLRRRAVHLDAAGSEIASTSWSGPEAMYRAQAEAWVASLRGDESPRLVDADEGMASVAICDAARRSSDRGGFEEVT